MDLTSRLESLHDGHLEGICLSSPSELRLKCRPLNETSIIFQVDGLLELWAGNFRQGNIILWAAIRSSIDEMDSNSIRGLARADDKTEIEAYKARMRERERQEPLRYFLLQSSYGCDLGAVYKGEVRIVDSF
jgi:hypothetical protein